MGRGILYTQLTDSAIDGRISRPYQILGQVQEKRNDTVDLREPGRRTLPEYARAMPHWIQISAPAARAEPFDTLLGAVKRSGFPFTVHEHAPTRTVEEASSLPFDVSRLVKAIAFRTATGAVVLAAIRGSARVDYARLAALAGVSRRELSSLSPGEVKGLLGVEPGSVSPIPLRADTLVVVDEAVLSLVPTLYCGVGRSDRTLEIAPADLVRLTGARAAAVARPPGDR